MTPKMNSDHLMSFKEREFSTLPISVSCAGTPIIFMAPFLSVAAPAEPRGEKIFYFL